MNNNITELIKRKINMNRLYEKVVNNLDFETIADKVIDYIDYDEIATDIAESIEDSIVEKVYDQFIADLKDDIAENIDLNEIHERMY